MNNESNSIRTQKSRSRRYVLWVGILGLMILNQSGCDTCFGCYDSSDPSNNPLTEILGLEISPNPAIRGDTLHFNCFIKDSLGEGFQYRWTFETEGFADTITTSSKLTVHVNTMADTLHGSIVVQHPTR